VATWVWIVIVLCALVVVGLLVLAVPKGLEAQRIRQRREAEQLRMHAERTLARAGQSEQSAQRAAEGVTEERAEAERLKRQVRAHQARAAELEDIAERESESAREQRAAAERTARKAQAVDPLVSDPDEDFDLDEALGSAPSVETRDETEASLDELRDESEDEALRSGEGPADSTRR
jgi:hypothetical protein